MAAVGVEVTAMYDAEARGNRLLERARLLSWWEAGAASSFRPSFPQAPQVMGRDGTPLRVGKGDGKGKNSGFTHPLEAGAVVSLAEEGLCCRGCPSRAHG